MTGILIGIFILIVSIILCIYETYDFFGGIFGILSFIFLLIHTPGYLTKNLRYELHIVERNSFIESLKNARLHKNNIELASVYKDIIDYNKNLAILKYNNKGIFDCYIDDRINELKPIK